MGRKNNIGCLPDEAKDLKKQKAGRLRQKKANSAAVAAAQSREKSKSYD
jgi:hypothetical protein